MNCLCRDFRLGTLYKYEIKAKNGLVFLKADPYANETEEQPGTASVVTELSGFEWKDQDWMARRKKHDDVKKEAMAVYEMHLGLPGNEKENGEIYNFRELAPLVACLCEEDELHPCGAYAGHGAFRRGIPGVTRSPVITRRPDSTARLRISCISWITFTGKESA